MSGLTNSSGRRYFRLGLVLAGFQFASAVGGQSPEAQLEAFQRFCTGNEPIKEAIVYREITRPDGTVFNRDWFRFGWQDRGATWYAQRLEPDANNPAKLVPLKKNVICGASLTHLWTISDEVVHVAGKGAAKGSVPERYPSLHRNFMRHAMALGVPNTYLGEIQWNRNVFKSRTVSKFDNSGQFLATNGISGHLSVNSNGAPVTCEYPPVGEFASGNVIYEYDPDNKGIPRAFTVKTEKSSAEIFRYEFLSVTLGEEDLRGTDGYVPTMFASSDIQRNAQLWMNGLSYSLLGDGRIVPAFKRREIIDPPGPLRIDPGLKRVLYQWFRRGQSQPLL